MIRCIVLLSLLLGLAVADAPAHGGRYLPPPERPKRIGPSGTEGGRRTGTGGDLPPAWTPPETRRNPDGARIPAASHWSRWWFLNRETVLDLDAVRREREGRPDGTEAEVRREERARALSVLLDAARDEDRDVATGAIVALGRARAGAATGVLLELLVSSEVDATVREAASVALGLIGTGAEGVREALLRRLANAGVPSRERAFAALGLGLTRDPSVLPALRDRLAESADGEVASACALALGLTGDGFVTPVLRRVLRTTTRPPAVRAHAAAALARFDGASAAPDLLALLSSRDVPADLRRQAALTLGALGRPELEAPRTGLRRAATAAEGPLARAFATVGLGIIGAPEDRSVVLERYRKGSPTVTAHAAIALGLLARRAPADEAARRFLRLQLQEPHDSDLLGALAVAAGIAGDAGSAPRLLEILDGVDDGALRGHAAAALGLLGARSALAPLRRSLDSARDPILIGEIAFALSLLADGEAEARLLSRLESARSDVARGTVAAALGRLRRTTVTRELRLLLADEDRPPIVRAFAAVGLGLSLRPGGPDPIERFGAHLNHAMARGAVAEALGYF